MDRKKVLDFLLLRQAFSSRNLSSIGLVILFILIYVFSGGKISWVPNVSRVRQAEFGAGTAPVLPPARSEFSGDVRNDEEEVRPNVRAPREVAPDASGSARRADGDSDLNEPKREDKLSEIRERLKNLGSK